MGSACGRDGSASVSDAHTHTSTGAGRPPALVLVGSSRSTTGAARRSVSGPELANVMPRASVSISRSTGGVRARQRVVGRTPGPGATTPTSPQGPTSPTSAAAAAAAGGRVPPSPPVAPVLPSTRPHRHSGHSLSATHIPYSSQHTALPMHLSRGLSSLGMRGREGGSISHYAAGGSGGGGGVTASDPPFDPQAAMLSAMAPPAATATPEAVLRSRGSPFARLLAVLPAPVVERFTAAWLPRRAAAGEVLYAPGQRGDVAYMVRTGSVSIRVDRAMIAPQQARSAKDTPGSSTSPTTAPTATTTTTSGGGNGSGEWTGGTATATVAATDVRSPQRSDGTGVTGSSLSPSLTVAQPPLPLPRPSSVPLSSPLPTAASSLALDGSFHSPSARQSQRRVDFAVLTEQAASTATTKDDECHTLHRSPMPPLPSAGLDSSVLLMHKHGGEMFGAEVLFAAPWVLEGVAGGAGEDEGAPFFATPLPCYHSYAVAEVATEMLVLTEEDLRAFFAHYDAAFDIIMANPPPVVGATKTSTGSPDARKTMEPFVDPSGLLPTPLVLRKALRACAGTGWPRALAAHLPGVTNPAVLQLAASLFDALHCDAGHTLMREGEVGQFIPVAFPPPAAASSSSSSAVIAATPAEVAATLASILPSLHIPTPTAPVVPHPTGTQLRSYASTTGPAPLPLHASRLHASASTSVLSTSTSAGGVSSSSGGGVLHVPTPKLYFPLHGALSWSMKGNPSATHANMHKLFDTAAPPAPMPWPTPLGPPPAAPTPAAPSSSSTTTLSAAPGPDSSCSVFHRKRPSSHKNNASSSLSVSAINSNATHIHTSPQHAPMPAPSSSSAHSPSPPPPLSLPQAGGAGNTTTSSSSRSATHPGLLGELGVLLGIGRTATLVCASPCVLLELPSLERLRSLLLLVPLLGSLFQSRLQKTHLLHVCQLLASSAAARSFVSWVQRREHSGENYAFWHEARAFRQAYNRHLLSQRNKQSAQHLLERYILPGAEQPVNLCGTTVSNMMSRWARVEGSNFAMPSSASSAPAGLATTNAPASTTATGRSGSPPGVVVISPRVASRSRLGGSGNGGVDPSRSPSLSAVAGASAPAASASAFTLGPPHCAPSSLSNSAPSATGGSSGSSSSAASTGAGLDADMFLEAEEEALALMNSDSFPRWRRQATVFSEALQAIMAEPEGSAHGSADGGIGGVGNAGGVSGASNGVSVVSVSAAAGRGKHGGSGSKDGAPALPSATGLHTPLRTTPTFSPATAAYVPLGASSSSTVSLGATDVGTVSLGRRSPASRSQALPRGTLPGAPLSVSPPLAPQQGAVRNLVPAKPHTDAWLTSSPRRGPGRQVQAGNASLIVA